ncbi:MAG: hypothetical protein BWX71_01844 [Deltaproteobacteria bacterium ADurb.Bin072]|nr:MAG: hypothetical protein BWX71_01844 [Deltaproteobacteria bacterium ADurb.Bin072]
MIPRHTDPTSSTKYDMEGMFTPLPPKSLGTHML